jgi:hypothetical protein
MAYIGNQPTDNFVTFATQNFSTSATSSYTLSHAVSNENEIALFINNVRQHPGSGKAYTASGTALTLSANTASTDVMYCIFLGRAIQSTVPATNSVTTSMLSINGGELFLDADGDTSITADTDDQIDFKTGGTDRASIDSSGNLKFNSGFGSVGTAYGVRAWVNFNGTGTIAIRGSANVSSLTDNGTGNHTVTFTTAMSDANYAVGMSATRVDDSGTDGFYKAHTYNTGNISVGTENNSSSPADFVIINLAVFR